RPVLGRRAVDHRRDVTVAEREPVAAVGRGRLVRETGAVEGAKEPVAAAVARKDAPCPVAAVRGRGEPEYEQSRRRISEARDGPAPVGFVCEPPDLLARDLLAPGDEPGAERARNDALLQDGDLSLRSSHRDRNLTTKRHERTRIRREAP